MGAKTVISYRRGCNLTWFRAWFHLVPFCPRMRQVYYLQYFGLVPGLVPLGSTWSHNARGILFTRLLLGSRLGSTWLHGAPGRLFTRYQMGTEGEQASKKLIFCSGAELGQARISRKSVEIGAESGYCKMVSLPHLENLEFPGPGKSRPLFQL